MWGAGAAGGIARFRTPHKLQIVKPMEGSLTLHTWAQLAKPTMSGKHFKDILFHLLVIVTVRMFMEKESIF